jgi:RNA polymerase sigma factor (sigma-70 family)
MSLISHDSHISAVYEELYPLLVGLAVRKFGIAEPDAETLAHEVFLSYLIKVSTIKDHRRWLVGAICNASRYYLRRREKAVSLTDNFAEVVDVGAGRAFDALPEKMTVQQAFDCLTPQCQRVLRLRYWEGYTVQEIADEVGITPKYAQKLLGKCLRQAEQWYVDNEGGS